MINFFRKIRQRLLTENKFSKYLLYAIGEIVLVVIGILIALSINNWNEDKKYIINEKLILENLLENLEVNSNILFEGSNQLDVMNISSSIILKVMRENLPYSDTLDVHFFQAVIRGDQRVKLTRDAYEAYKNAGFDAIRSKTIQTKIIHLFDEKYNNLNEWRSYLIELASFDQGYWTSNFLQHENGFKPLNYDLIIKDDSFQSYYYGILRTRSVLNNYILESQKESKTVISLLKEELKRI
jgi:hypothetical protein